MKVLMTGNRLEDNVKGGMVSCASILKNCDVDIDYFWTWSREKRLGKISFIWRMPRINEYDLVHIHSAGGIDFVRNLFFIFYLSLFKVKILLHLHGSEFSKELKRPNFFVNRLLKKITYLIVLSNDWSVKFQKAWELDRDRILILPNPIMERHLSSINKSTASLKCVFIGELSHRKGVLELLQAISTIDSPIHFMILGDGELRSRVEEEVMRLQNSGKKIEFLGFIQAKERDFILDNSDICILPSKAENLPITLIEAMHSSCALIASAVGSVDTLVDDSNGILMKDGSVKSIQEALKKINGLVLRDLQRNSFNKSKEYSHKIVLEKLKNIYNKFN